MSKEKVILAYSGGLDTTAIIPWLKENFDYDVVCCCIDCGQGEELDGLEERAKLSGASKLYIENIIDGSYMKPGRHIRVVKSGHKYIYALPGFPYSASVCTFLFIAPLLRKMRAQSFALPTVKAYMGELYKKRSKFVEFTACNLRFKQGQLIVDLEGKKEGSSAILNNLLDNPVLLRVEKDVQKIIAVSLFY